MAEKAGSALKDLLLLLVVFGGILGALFMYTQVWPPAVIVESGSMMHRDSEVSYGRSWLTGGPPTIDPGDLVLVKSAGSREDVETWAEQGRMHYGDYGDVVVYYAGGQREGRTPIIHRAMAWVDVERENGDVRYIVQWADGKPCPSEAAAGTGNTCVFGSDGITIDEIGLRSYKPFRGGLITKGDNPVTNTRPDQVSGLSDIVQLEWLQGKGRAEVPWLGLIKLSLSPAFNEPNCVTGGRDFKWWEESRICRGWVAIGRAYAPKDLWIMLGVSLMVLVGIPLAYDGYRAVADRRRQDGESPPDDGTAPPLEAAPTLGSPGGPGDPPGREGPGESPAPETPQPDAPAEGGSLFADPHAPEENPEEPGGEEEREEDDEASRPTS